MTHIPTPGIRAEGKSCVPSVPNVPTRCFPGSAGTMGDANGQSGDATKSVYALLAECHARQIELQARGDQLDIDAPVGELTDELLQRLRDAKAQLLVVLAGGPISGVLADQDLHRGAVGPSVKAGKGTQLQVAPGGDPCGADRAGGDYGDAGHDPKIDSKMAIWCPWCSSPWLLDGTGGLWCVDCERLAWEVSGTGGLVRCDVAGLDTTFLPEPCPACGRLERWEDLAGGWHCERCEPRTRAIQLRQRAAELRERYFVMGEVAVLPQTVTVAVTRDSVVPSEIIADPVMVCRDCGHSVVPGQPGRPSGRCFGCWSKQN